MSPFKDVEHLLRLAALFLAAALVFGIAPAAFVPASFGTFATTFPDAPEIRHPRVTSMALWDNAPGFHRKTPGRAAGPGGTSLATPAGMSPAGRALHERFESVCRSELQRLRRKTASLTAEERARVHALALEVTHGLAVTLDAALDAPGGTAIAPVVMRLFAVTAPSLEETT